MGVINLLRIGGSLIIAVLIIHLALFDANAWPLGAMIPMVIVGSLMIMIPGLFRSQSPDPSIAEAFWAIGASVCFGLAWASTGVDPLHDAGAIFLTGTVLTGVGGFMTIIPAIADASLHRAVARRRNLSGDERYSDDRLTADDCPRSDCPIRQR